MVRRYWQAVCGLAWAATVSTLRLNSLVGFMMWALGTLAVLVGLFFWGSADSSHDEFLTRLFLAFATIGAIPFVFAWQLIRTPAAMEAKSRLWVQKLSEAILETRRADAAVAGLAERHERGLRIFREKEPGWLDAMKAWELELTEFVRQNFSAEFLQHVAVIEKIEYVIINNNGRFSTKETPAALDDRAFYAKKLNKIGENIAYATTYYRGGVNKLDIEYALIDQYGLPEHLSRQGIG
jgi:hypothetical protein